MSMESFVSHGALDKWSPDSLRSLGRLDFVAASVLDGVLQGSHKSMRRGFSSEFFDYRPYEPYDDAAGIDWRLYAKTEKYYVKRFEAETNLECRILFDASRSMTWSWNNRTSKLEYAAMLSASIAMLFTRMRDLVGIHTFGSEHEFNLEPRSSRTHLEHIFSILSAGREYLKKPPSLTDTVKTFVSTHSHRCVVILISDLEVRRGDAETALRILGSKNDEVYVFHLLDRNEIEPDFGNATHIRDSETGELAQYTPSMKRTISEKVAAFRELTRSLCLGAGASFIPLDTSRSPVEAILELNRARDRRAGGGC